jgi:hypothetical protein
MLPVVMREIRYLAYGSNLHPDRLRRRVPSARLRGVAALPGYTLRFEKRGMDGSAKANLAAAPDAASAHVAVYTMAAADRAALDRCEHLGIGYEIHELDLPGHGRCFTYLATASHVTDALRPFCWYRELVLAGCLTHRFPSAYVEAVSSVMPVEDPDPVRRRRHWALLKRFGAASCR